MVRYIVIFLIALLFHPGISLSNGADCEEALSKTKKYIETIEWDEYFMDKAKDYLVYKDVYLQKLRTGTPDEIFTSTIMLGLLNIQESAQEISLIKIDDLRVSIGVIFAQCRLNECSEKNVIDLKRIGRTTQIIGNAISLKYLEVVELLSILDIEGFIEYANELKNITDEVYQKEAIEVAINRYKLIHAKQPGRYRLGCQAVSTVTCAL